MKDATAVMGSLLPDDFVGRDAVHVATVAVTAGEYLPPGTRVILADKNDRGEHVAASAGHHAAVGIVDPYLESPVRRGGRFLLFLMPRTITSLRHQWTHPAFADAKLGDTYAPPSARLASEQWLREFCARTDCPGYEEVIALAARRADGFDVHSDQDYLLVRGSDAHGDIPPEFWDHAAVVLGREIKGRKATHFSCSC